MWFSLKLWRVKLKPRSRKDSTINQHTTWLWSGSCADMKCNNILSKTYHSTTNHVIMYPYLFHKTFMNCKGHIIWGNFLKAPIILTPQRDDGGWRAAVCAPFSAWSAGLSAPRQNRVWRTPTAVRCPGVLKMMKTLWFSDVDFVYRCLNMVDFRCAVVLAQAKAVNIVVLWVVFVQHRWTLFYHCVFSDKKHGHHSTCPVVHSLSTSTSVIMLASLVIETVTKLTLDYCRVSFRTDEYRLTYTIVLYHRKSWRLLPPTNSQIPAWPLTQRTQGWTILQGAIAAI